uniref:Matrin-type domain-containing protein n=1 Tax=Paramoeba aestuarina TaxID=180227 RepID=A0A7S4UCX1_9EUKA|eukprot:CAMPEP_0201526502 /NCGR_PEP_ID=MMETSP0161_2-20130828/31990_1 /ASSEMBLY_ACC=CAM_ASM_000251 /TAXON_ID=180227 /ORGANISM="Neoparamoeba aestuarina, Strain SoJaBio B1-5/56/2" /LENGTH=261 /DNA_ID=CAMNT_0047926921 /DNA_START=42 /DNA_END=827 /DNA_ORIENTATION=-
MRAGREFGSKPGAGGAVSAEWSNVDRRERMRQIAMERIDLSKDPYFFRNHLGSYECKLCLTLHNTEGNYLAHTQGKKHQNNQKRRAAREAKNAEAVQANMTFKPKVIPQRKTRKIGRPGYKVTKQVNSETQQKSLFFEIEYTQIEEGLQPRTRVVSTWDQTVEAKDPRFQYLLVAAEPYETIAFKIPNAKLDGPVVPSWDRDSLKFQIELHYEPGELTVPNSTAPAPPATQNVFAPPPGAPPPGPHMGPPGMASNPLPPGF